MQIPQPDSLPLASVNRAMALISLVAGLALLFGGGWFIHHFHLDEFVLDHATAQGQVVQNKLIYVVRSSAAGTTQRFMGGWFYRAVVRFPAGSDGDITLEEGFAWVRPLFKAGQKVRILYDPANPRHAMIDRGWKNYVVPGVIAVFAFLMFLGGVQRLSGIGTSRGREYDRRRAR